MSGLGIKPFYNEAQLDLGDGAVLRMVLNFRVIDTIEGLLGRGMDDLLGELSSSVALMGKFLWAMTREHHPELGFDDIAGVLFSPVHGTAVNALMGDLIRRSFHIAETPAEGEQRPRPPKSSRGAPKGSSPSGSRRGSPRTVSGRKPRARS